MTTTRIGRVKRDLAAAQARFLADVEALAVEAHRLLLPYFRSQGWRYVTGNATWLVQDARGEAVDDEQLPDWVQELLGLEVRSGDYLGFYVRDIEREERLARPRTRPAAGRSSRSTRRR